MLFGYLQYEYSNKYEYSITRTILQPTGYTHGLKGQHESQNRSTHGIMTSNVLFVKRT